MTRPKSNTPEPPKRRTAPELNRTRAAVVLHQARAALDARLEVSTDVEYALGMLPDSPSACRLYVKLMIMRDDLDAADAVIARGLLHKPDDPSLRTQRAVIRLRQKRIDAASAEIQIALVARPQHSGVLRVAAEIEIAARRFTHAVEYLQRARQRNPSDHRLLEKLIATMISAGDPDAAESVFKELPSSDRLMLARIRRGQGRMLDAIELLQAAADDEIVIEPRDEVLAELIDALDNAGYANRLRQLLTCDLTRYPNALANAAETELAGGRPGRVLEMINDQEPNTLPNRPLEHFAVAAAVMLEDFDLAAEKLESLRTADQLDPELMVRAWRKALLGQSMIRQQSPKKAGADPKSNLLQPVLAAALAVFDENSDQPPSTSSVLRPAEREQHRIICRHALHSMAA